MFRLNDKTHSPDGADGLKAIIQSLKAGEQSADAVSGSLVWTLEQTLRLQTPKQLKFWVCAQNEVKTTRVTRIRDPLTSADERCIIMRHKRSRRPTLNDAVERRPNAPRPSSANKSGVLVFGCGSVMLFTVTAQTQESECGKRRRTQSKATSSIFFPPFFE